MITATILDAFFSFGEIAPFFALFLFLVFIAFWFHAFVIVYHLARFGIGTRPKIVSFVFFIGSAVLFSITIFSYTQVEIPSLEKLLNSSNGLIMDLRPPFEVY